MAGILKTLSTSLKEYRLLPGYTEQNGGMKEISLRTRLCRKGDDFIHLELPFISAAMQAVTGTEMAVTLAQMGGVGVVPVSRGIEEQCGVVDRVKRFKAGFQTGLVTFSAGDPIGKLDDTIRKSGYGTFPVTDNGLFHGKLIGVITRKDYDPRYDRELPVKERMRTDIQCGTEITDLKEANALMIRYGRGFLPIVSREGTLQAVVFRKDLDKHLRHPMASVDEEKRLIAGAAISTHPEDRIRAEQLIDQGTDFLVIDASDGHTAWQEETLKWLKSNFAIPVIAGNVVTKEGFLMLAEAGADAVKIGMGIGSGCITQEVKGTGRGQARAITEIAEERDRYTEEKRYVPLIADGSISGSAEMIIALALGADTLMMGNFFSRFTEGNSRFVKNAGGETCKEYWMEGSRRALNNRRYSQSRETFFEEGISGMVRHLGSIYDCLPEYVLKIKSAFSTAGAKTIGELHRKAVLEQISPGAAQDSGVYGMIP